MDFKKIMEERVSLKGLVRYIEANKELGEDVLVLEHELTKAYIPRSEISIRPFKNSLIRFVGTEVEFIVKEVKENGTLICSIKEVEEAKLIELSNEIAENPQAEYEAVVTYAVRYGVYVSVNGVNALLPNREFALDYTNANEILKIGDTVKVKIQKINGAKVVVEAVEKYCAETNITIDDFQPNQIVLGTVRTVKTDKVFTCIAPNLDVLSSVPLYFEVREGDRVKVKINQIREDGRLRGKIVKVLPE